MKVIRARQFLGGGAKPGRWRCRSLAVVNGSRGAVPDPRPAGGSHGGLHRHHHAPGRGSRGEKIAAGQNSPPWPTGARADGGPARPDFGACCASLAAPGRGFRVSHASSKWFSQDSARVPRHRPRPGGFRRMSRGPQLGRPARERDQRRREVEENGRMHDFDDAQGRESGKKRRVTRRTGGLFDQGRDSRSGRRLEIGRARDSGRAPGALFDLRRGKRRD